MPQRDLRRRSLSRPHTPGQYLGVFGLGAGVAEAFGPGLLIGLCITWGRPGWYVTGVMFALTGLAVPFAARWVTGRGRRAETPPEPVAAVRMSAW